MPAKNPQEARKSRLAARVAVAFTACVALAMAMVALVSACLPDLDPLKPLPDTGLEETSSISSSICGNGIIDTLIDGGDAGESCDPGEAGPPGCTSCQVVCEGKIDDAGGHCYFALAPATEYPSARSACIAAGGHVVTLASTREAEIASLVAGDAGAYWVGLAISNNVKNAYIAATVDEPGFPGNDLTQGPPPPCTGCFGVGVTDSGTFPIDPAIADSGVKHDCLIATGDGGWLQVACTGGTRSVATVCEREVPGQRAQFCGGPFCTTVPITASTKRYVLVLSGATAKEAADFCTNNYGASGGRLVVLQTREEREQLVHEINLLFPPVSKPQEITTWWIGLSSKDGAWTWDDGVADDAGTYAAPWGSRQPAATGGTRAFLRVDEERFDTQLAYSEDEQTQREGDGARRLFVCERK